MAAAALIALPAAGSAQTPAGQQPQPQTPTQSTAPQTPQTSAASPAEHVSAAKQALSSIQANTLPASARPKIQQLRTHLNNLERDIAKSESASSGASASAKSNKSANWGTEVAAIDKTLTELIGPDTGSAASSGSMTSGTAGSATGTSGKSATTIDDATKEQLRTVRQHITAIATSMSGTPKTEASPEAAASPSATPSATPSAPSATPSATPSAPSTTPATPSTTPSAEPSATPTPSANQQTTPAGAQSPAAQGQVNRDAAKQHLSEARESLSQLAAMPEAAKLQGDARNQVSQLIANFNELITTQSDWKAAYAKLEATLSALLGPEGASQPPAAAGTTGTAGAPATAGTTGATAPLEPAVRAKLEEFRTHMKEFEQAAGGAPAAASNSPSMSPSVSTGSTASPAAPSPAQATPSPTTPPASPTPTEPSAAPAPQNPTPNPTPSANPTPAPTGTTGSAGVPGATGTSGSTSSNVDADKHLDAIADILSKAKDGKLDKDQTEQIKMHVDQLRQLLKK
jgi:hypothetical protein